MATTTPQRLDAYRSLRAEIESSILPLATSVDGRRFSFQAAIEGLELRLGGYVVLGDAALGQVRSLDVAEMDLGQVGLPPGDGEMQLSARMPIRLARGEGVILDGHAGPFHDHPLRPATADEVGAWLARGRPGRARLAVGTLPLAGDVPVELEASGFDRHTFLCGQSGSGKSYSLGLVLEQLLLRTALKLVILDPNSDVVRLHEARDDAAPEHADAWGAVAGGIAVRSSGEGPDRLRLRFGELDQAEQGALLGLDPIADRDEYAELAALLAADTPQTPSALAERPEARGLALRIRNLGLEGFGVWARGDAGTVLDDLDDPAVRCLVVDVGSLPTREEQGLVAAAVLRGLWERRLRREPVLLVVDEAHNVCPAVPGDALTALATEHAVRIAGEGRKFGIYMLVATQRPQKVHEHVLTQCDNLVLMRLNSSADAEFVASLYGFAPPGLVGLATDFTLGQALVAGKIAPHPAIVRFGSRVAREGGGDVDSSWARAG
ncbi:MAG TPA: ATP-binding protein [Solirubrobacteraceae bacterium]|nr:ATP-binding protein [Solirubrobacteraceae bacterium]